MKIRLMRAKLFHEGGQKDTMQFIIALHKFGDGPEKCFVFVQRAETGAGALFISLFNQFLSPFPNS